MAYPYVPGVSPGSAVVYLHGDGMICGNWAIYDPVRSYEMATTGVPERQAQLQLAHCSNKSLRQVFCSMKTIGLSAAATFGS